MMKNSKYVLVAFLLACASSLLAQDLYRGDTIRILPSDKHYLTTEKMSNWVYDVDHIILKVGGRRFQNGVLVKGILSWVDPTDIKLVSPCISCREEDLARQREIDSVAAAVLAEQAAIEAARAAEVARAQAVADSIAQAQAVADSIAQAQADSIAKAQADSIEAYNLRHRPVNRFTIGVRGGAASMMQDMQPIGKGKVGFDAALDLQYAYYGKTKKEHMVGFLIGVSAAFARNSVNGTAVADYTLPTCDGDIAYHIDGQVNKLVMNEIQVEVPVMFSLVTKRGFFFNIGPKLMVPVYSFYNQNVSASDISATFVKEGVTAVNDIVTGIFPGDKVQVNGQWHNAMVHVMAAGELGGEIKLKNGDSFGIGVYGGYSLYNNYKQLAQPVPSYVQITAPTATSCAIVDVKGVSDVHMNKLGYWDAGLKLAYHFNWPYRNDNKKK